MDESLSYESFFEGANRATQKAMDDHANREFDEFALHSGVAVERLAKAALVRVSPLYLVEMRNNNTDMLLHFGGGLELPSDKVRTIGAKDALARLRKLQILPADSQLDTLIDMRNGVAHASGGEGAKFLLPTFARAVEQILGHLGESSERFWRHWASAVRMGLNERESEVTREVHLRIRQARHRFDERFVGLPEGARDLVVGAPQRGQGDGDRPYDAPGRHRDHHHGRLGDLPRVRGPGIGDDEPNESVQHRCHPGPRRIPLPHLPPGAEQLRGDQGVRR
ncbi:hypothetical protein FNV64_41875 [Streptomyces sp. S1A1-7]|uniref:hypothetical protein n=1 Tax=Streptomyces sp. S1A1-7 TaxID=2594459 RepID=UPI0011658C8A|nr:hypothetical protein [Streptomyces sp. S1A1-7]QDN81264.1 hypothetical protein FNV64_41875 [Streptomyces sp. S1A1-7]